MSFGSAIHIYDVVILSLHSIKRMDTDQTIRANFSQMLADEIMKLKYSSAIPH